MTVQIQCVTQFKWLESENVVSVEQRRNEAVKVIRDEHGSIDYGYYAKKARALRSESQCTFFNKLFKGD